MAADSSLAKTSSDTSKHDSDKKTVSRSTRRSEEVPQGRPRQKKGTKKETTVQGAGKRPEETVVTVAEDRPMPAHVQQSRRHGRLLNTFVGRWMLRPLVSHLCFVFNRHYPMLFMAAIGGRSLFLLAKLFGVPVTVVYKCKHPTYNKMNMIYSLMTPLLRSSFVSLTRQPFTADHILQVVKEQRRGAVWCELLISVLQIIVQACGVDVLLIPLTVLGILLNTIPRQFYAQLKLMMRGLVIDVLGGISAHTLQCLPTKKLLRAGPNKDLPLFDERSRELGANFLPLKGRGWGTCRMLETEILDFVATVANMVILVYLLAFALCKLGWIGRIGLPAKDADLHFPFWAVVVTRLARFFGNLITCETVLSNSRAKRDLYQLYCIQRLHVLREASEVSCHSGAGASASASILRQLRSNPEFIKLVARGFDVIGEKEIEGMHEYFSYARDDLTPPAVLPTTLAPEVVPMAVSVTVTLADELVRAEDRAPVPVLGEIPGMEMFAFLSACRSHPDMALSRYHGLMLSPACGCVSGDASDAAALPAPFDSVESLVKACNFGELLLLRTARLMATASPGASESAAVGAERSEQDGPLRTWQTEHTDRQLPVGAERSEQDAPF